MKRECSTLEMRRKTFIKWSWLFVQLISDLNAVCLSILFWFILLILIKLWQIFLDSSIDWENSWDVVYCSVDGTDCTIYWTTPFDSKWYYPKFRVPGLQYEIRLSVASEGIIWCNGPFPCGDSPDLRIFKKIMLLQLTKNKQVIADNGYFHCITLSSFTHPEKNHSPI